MVGPNIFQIKISERIKLLTKDKNYDWFEHQVTQKYIQNKITELLVQDKR